MRGSGPRMTIYKLLLCDIIIRDIETTRRRMGDPKKMMKLGLFFEVGGHHIAAWRSPEADVHARQTFEHFAEIARTAERGKFDLLFTADTYATFGADDVDAWCRTTAASRLEPMTLMGG